MHPGGAEKVVAQIATGLDPERYEVRVACVRETGRIGDEVAAHGVPVTPLMNGPESSPYSTPWTLLGVVRRFRPHVVHSHGIVALTAAGPLALLGALPRWVHTFHFGNYPYASRRQMFLERILSRRATKLVCVASSQRDSILRHHRFSPQKVVIIPNGVGASPFGDNEEVRRGKRAELGLSTGDFVVGTVCVLSEQKGIEYLLEAAGDLSSRCAGMRFLVVGSGPLEKELREKSRRLGLSDRVVFTGWRSDIEQILAAIDVFVMPSLWEAMPLALLEAMAARRAIVVTDVGNNAEIVAHGDCAALVRPRDAAGLAGAIEALHADRELAAGMAARALARFNNHYDVKRMIGSHARLYRSIETVAGLKDKVRYAARRISNTHTPGEEPDIFLFATPRGGSTWLMEIIASQPGMKFYDEPLNPRRADVAHGGWIQDYEALMPGSGDADRVIEFLRNLQQGRHGHMNPTPLRPLHRFRTDRIIFKIHEIEHLMGEVTQKCGGIALCLLRHPIATSLSRRLLPRLDLFLESEHYAKLLQDEARMTEARRIAASGSHLQRAAVSWCFENLEALTAPPPGLLLIAYEELVLNPDRSCDLLLDRLSLPDRERMIQAFGRPASNISMSGSRTAALLQRGTSEDTRLHLVSKWQAAIAPQEIAQVDDIMSIFGLDAYKAGEVLPHRKFLHFEDTQARAERRER
jgi:glycosyltransferase involved in cell wall biosynthesis